MADAFGRKQLLILGALLMALAGSVFAVNSDPLILAIAAVFGTISPSGKEVGPFLSIEQAILPQTTQDLYRTKVFSAYNLVGSIFGALRAPAVGLPLLLPLPPLSGYRFLLWSYVFCALLMMVLFALLSPSIEVITGIKTQSGRFGVQRHAASS
jgi:MFS family permease